MKFPINKPGLFVRLGNLIVFQGFFVFLALALILFYPNHEIQKSESNERVKEYIQDIGQQVSSFYEGKQGSSGNEFIRIPPESVPLSQSILSSGLFSISSDGHLRCVASLGGDDTITPNILTDGYISEKLVHLAAREDSGFYVSIMVTPDIEVCYYRPVNTLNTPMVYAASIRNTKAATERAELVYAVFLLFLVSTLVSLLTVYILWKRFKEPLERLSIGLEKSSSGDLYYQILSEGESELTELATYANKVVKTLWTSKKQAHEYGVQYHEVSQELVQSQRFLSTLIDSSPSLIIVTNSKKEIIIFNQNARNVFGYEVNEVLNKNVEDFLILPPGDLNEKSMSGQKSFETLCRKKNKTQFPVYSVMAPVCGDDGSVTAYMFILHDISESKSFQEMMVRLDRYSTRGEMAGEIAHEINNFLAILSGNLELMPILMRKGDQNKINSKLELMRNTVDKITRFSDNLMDPGGDEIILEVTNINQVIENVIAFLKPQNRFDRLTIKTNLDHELPLLKVDLSQIQQLLVNVLNNSADAFFDDKKNGEVMIATSHTEIDQCPFVQVQISDNGPGVQEDKIDILFVKRFTTKKRGHGIGLITCKKIIEQHGGKISYYFNQGANFVISLPVIPPRKDTNSNTQEHEQNQVSLTQV